MLCKIAKHLAATVPDDILGSFSNDDGDGNENGKKAKSLICKNNTSARASHFFVHSLPSLHDYDVKIPILRFMLRANGRNIVRPPLLDVTCYVRLQPCCMLLPVFLRVASFFFWQNKAMFLLKIIKC